MEVYVHRRERLKDLLREFSAAALAARAPAPAAQDNPAQEGGRALGALVGLVVRKARDLLR